MRKVEFILYFTKDKKLKINSIIVAQEKRLVVANWKVTWAI